MVREGTSRRTITQLCKLNGVGKKDKVGQTGKQTETFQMNSVLGTSTGDNHLLGDSEGKYITATLESLQSIGKKLYFCLSSLFRLHLLFRNETNGNVSYVGLLLAGQTHTNKNKTS